MKKTSILILGAMLLALALTACAPAAPVATEAPKAEAPAATTAPVVTVDPTIPVYEYDTSKLKANKNYNIAMVLKNNTNEVWLQHFAAAQQAAKDMGFTLG